MEVILIEKHPRLGDIGNIAVVKDGYARNYLIPNKKAIRATAENKKTFEMQKAILQKEFDNKRSHAEKIKHSIDGKHIILERQSGEDSRLYGSVSSNDIVKAIKAQLNQDLHKSSVNMIQQIKYTGVYNIQVNVFADVTAALKVAVARNEVEALDELKNESKKKLEQEVAAFEADHYIAEEPADPFKDQVLEAEIEEATEEDKEAE